MPVVANIGIAEIILVVLVMAIGVGAFVGLVALGTRLGTRHVRNDR